MKIFSNVIFYSVILIFCLIWGACASSQTKDDISADLAIISEPVKVSIISLQVGERYFSSHESAIEGFCEFYSNQIENILSQFQEKTGVILDIGSFTTSLNNLSGITVRDNAGVRVAEWHADNPTEDIWARITVIYAETSVVASVYILKPGKDLIFGVYTVPAATIWLGPDSKVSQR